MTAKHQINIYLHLNILECLLETILGNVPSPTYSMTNSPCLISSSAMIPDPHFWVCRSKTHLLEEQYDLKPKVLDFLEGMMDKN